MCERACQASWNRKTTDNATCSQIYMPQIQEVLPDYYDHITIFLGIIVSVKIVTY